MEISSEVLKFEILTEYYGLNHKSAKIDRIPEPGIPDDLVGSSSVFCMPRCLEISPTGTNSLYNAIYMCIYIYIFF